MVFKWKKLGRVFDPTEITDVPYMQEFAQAPSVVIHDDFVRVYFSCRPPIDTNGQYVSYSAFVDLERNDLLKIKRFADKPILPLGEVGTFDEFGIYPVSVLKEDDRYLAYYAGWTRCISVPFNVAIGVATSNDGEHFSKLGSGPVLSYTMNEPFVISGPKIRKFNNQYFLFYIAGNEWINDNGRVEPIYKIRMAKSNDGINWMKQDTNLIENILGAEEAQASPDVFYKDGTYHMFFCYRGGRDYRNSKNGYLIGYASSKDLINWFRHDSKVGITVSEKGWDSEMVSYPHVFELDGEIYMMYLGNQVGKYGFGLAQLEKDNL
ncbi:MAG: glycosylase [Crocinitomicaceae bacterium]|nr:MAG: glycosylase [Crocinitomicaceae bacterium]